MTGVKSLLVSKTVWGIIISTLCRAAEAAGYHILPADQEQISYIVFAVGGALGDLYGVYGRIRATKQIGSGSVQPQNPYAD